MDTLVVIGVFGVGFWIFYAVIRQIWRMKFIENYAFSPALKVKVKKLYPNISDEHLKLLFEGLREYFYIYQSAPRKNIAMPSKAVDVAWHEFILFTKEYQRFCNKAFGRFLHHTPVEAMANRSVASEGLKRAWLLSCQREKIDPKTPEKLPILFSIDSLLGIDDGYHYALDCQSSPNGTYCVSDIGCSSCGSGCSSDSDGCGSGCGGD